MWTLTRSCTCRAPHRLPTLRAVLPGCLPRAPFHEPFQSRAHKGRWPSIMCCTVVEKLSPGLEPKGLGFLHLPEQAPFRNNVRRFRLPFPERQSCNSTLQLIPISKLLSGCISKDQSKIDYKSTFSKADRGGSEPESLE